MYEIGDFSGEENAETFSKKGFKKKNQIGYRFKKIKENINKSYIKSKGYGNLCNNWVNKKYTIT